MGDKIKLEGVMSKGYGSIPKLVMLDRELSIEAKAIYAYIASYSGNGDSAFPSIKKICYDLQINEKRFNRHKKVLFDKGYIEVSQERKGGGKFASNVYTIKHYIQPTTQNGGTDSDNDEPYTQNGSTGNGSTHNGNSENGGTNNNSFTNNSSTNNSFNKQQQPASENHPHFLTAWKENGFGDINQANIKTLEEWITKFDGNDSIVIKAIKVASDLGADKRNMAYLRTILTDWKNRGFKVGEDFEAAEQKRKSEKQKKKSAPRNNFNKSTTRKETVPEHILNPQTTETPMSEEDKQEFMERLKKIQSFRDKDQERAEA